MKLFKRKVLATQEVLLESVFEETPSEEDDEEARTLMSMTRKEMEEADPESITEDILETDSVDTSDLIEEVEEPLLDSHIMKAIDKAWKWPADAVITYDENSDCNDIEVVVDLERAVMDQDQDEMEHTYQSQEGKSPKLDKMLKNRRIWTRTSNCCKYSSATFVVCPASPFLISVLIRRKNIRSREILDMW